VLTSPETKIESDFAEAKAHTPIVGEGIPVAGVDTPLVDVDAVNHDKENELARVDSASKATDSDVEAARAKTALKKANKKKKKKGGAAGAEVKVVN
jgi:hypothetical protein